MTSASSSAKGVSSFALLDGIISYLLHDNVSKIDGVGALEAQFPNVQRVVIAGHSSGGQFVQRWSMVTPIWDQTTMKAVVINPSSYAYLTSLRYMDTQWRLPNAIERQNCPDYNHWEWGVEQDLFFEPSIAQERVLSTIETPLYVQNTLERYGNVHNLTTHYSRRGVVYLVGGLDVCNIPDTTSGWCNSHGLETSCRDRMQGSNRLERHHWYCTMLQFLNISHRCFIVPYVGHDHSLMFSSDIGLTFLFEQMDNLPVTKSSDNVN
jgi:hypothetical protein